MALARDGENTWPVVWPGLLGNQKEQGGGGARRSERMNEQKHPRRRQSFPGVGPRHPGTAPAAPYGCGRKRRSAAVFAFRRSSRSWLIRGFPRTLLPPHL